MSNPLPSSWIQFLNLFLDATVLIDRQGQILDLNAAAEQLWDCSAQAMQGQWVTRLLPEWHQSGSRDTQMAQRPDGHWMPVQIHSIHLADGDGEAAMVLLVKAVGQLTGMHRDLPGEVFASIFAASPLPMALIDLATRHCLAVNEALVQWLGGEPGEIEGHRWDEIGLLVDASLAQEMLDTVQREGHLRNYDASIRARSGGIRLGRFSVDRLDTANGPCAIAVMNDLTDRRQAETALLTNEARYRAYMEHAPIMMLVMDEHTRCVDCNPAAVDLLGYSAAELLRLNLNDLVEGEDGAVVSQALAGSMRGGQTVGECRLKHRAGHPVWVDMQITALNEGRYVVYGQNVTQRRQAEVALRESEATYRLLADHAADVIWALDLQTQKFRYVSPSVERLRGYTVEEVLQQSLLDVMTPASLAMANADLSVRIQAFLAGDPAAVTRTNEVEQLRRDGSVVWTEVVSTLLRTPQGGLEMLGVSRDISERKANARKLADEAARHRVLFEQSRDGLVLLDEGWRVVEANVSFERLLGLAPAGAVGRDFPDWAALLSSTELLPTEPRVVQTQLPRIDGTRVEVDITATPITWSEQQYLFCICRDRTEQVLAQQAEENFRIFFHNSPAQTVLYRLIRDAEGVIVDWEIYDINEKGAASIGLERSQALGRRAMALFGPDVMLPYLTTCREVMQSGQSRQFETYFETNQRLYLSAVVPIRQEFYAIISVDMTERQVAEAAVREREAQYRTLFETMANGVVYQNAEGAIIQANPAAERLLGLTLAQLQGRSSVDPRWRAIHEDGTPFPGEMHPAMMALRTGQPVENVVLGVFNPVTDSYRWMVVNAIPQFRPGETVPYQVYTTQMDITERKAVETALAESEARYRVIFEGAAEGIVAVSLDDRSFQYVNPVMCTLFGYAPEEFRHLVVTDLHPPEAAAAVLAEFDALAQEQKTAAANVPCRRKDGRWFYSDVKAQLTQLSGRSVLVGFFSDVTERRRAEALLRARLRLSELPLEIALDDLLQQTLDQAELITDSRIGYFHFVDADQVTLSLQNWSSRTLRELCTAEGKGQHYPLNEAGVWADSLRVGRPLIYNDYVSLPDRKGLPAGHAPVTRLMTIPVYRDGRAVAMIGVGNKPADYEPEDLDAVTLLANEAWDLVLRRRAENALRASEEKYRQLVESLETAVATLDGDGCYHYVNPVTAQTLGRTPDSLAGRRMSEFFPPAVADRQLAEIRQVMATGTGQITEFPVDFPGRTTWFRTSLQPIRDETGQITRVLINAVDVTERKMAEAVLEERVRTRTLELEASRQRLELASRSAGIGIWDWHCLTGEMLWDDQMLHLYGVQRSEFDGTVSSWERGVHPDDLPAQQALVAATLRGEAEFDTEFRVIWPDSSVHYIKATAFTLFDDSRQPIRMIGVNYDVTARRQAEEVLRVQEETLRHANQELEQAMRVKDEFLAGMSHELRTPLNGILSLAESLEEQVYGPLAPQQSTAVHTISEAGHHLLALINDVLDLSKIEAGKLEIHLEPVDVDTICQACLRMIRQPATQKHLRVSYSLDGDLTAMRADERRLKQMLMNLLSNAVKFTPEGGQVGLEVVRITERPVIRFTVWDTGIGIALDKQALLFQPFTQIESGLAREHGGTGLGLSLVRRLAQLHGGTITLESQSGQGSRFHLELPLMPVDLRPASPPTAFPRSAIVVDDSITDSEHLARYLRELGMQIVIERTGAAVVQTARQVHPEVIFLDLLLPDQSGWEVLRALRQDPETQGIPVILISVLDERPQGLAAGANEYVVKPPTRDGIRGALQNAVPTLDQAGHTATALVVEPPVLTDAPQILLAEDNLINQRAMQDFLRAQGYQVLLAQNGVEALRRAQETHPALILMDIQMPQLDGLEAIRQLRARPDFAHTPIIALTALAMPGDRERCLAAGADDYLAKPIGLRQLAATLEKWLSRPPSVPTRA